MVKLHQHLLKGAIELCWMYKEIFTFKQLITEWSNCLLETWLARDLPIHRPTLFSLVSLLVDWANTAHALNISLHVQQKQMWLAVGQPFET